MPLRTVYLILTKSATDRSSDRDNKDQFGCLIDDISVLNGIKLYSFILDVCVSFLYFHHTFTEMDCQTPSRYTWKYSVVSLSSP